MHFRASMNQPLQSGGQWWLSGVPLVSPMQSERSQPQTFPWTSDRQLPTSPCSGPGSSPGEKKKTQVNVISLRHCYESSIMLPVWPVLQTDVYFTMKKIVYNLYNLRPSKSFLSSVEFMWHVKHKQCSPTNLWVLLYCEKEILSSDATDNMACSTASTFYGSRWGCDTCFADIVFQLLWMKLFLQYEILEFNLPGFQKKKYCNFNHFKINF